MTDTEWRLRVTRRNVELGLQDPRDLESIEQHGYVIKPTNSLCRELAIEYARIVDNGRPSDRRKYFDA